MVLKSARVWFASALVVLVACSAVDGGGPDTPSSLDPFHNEEVESLQQGATKPTGVNGQSNYCDNPAAPCTVGEGDCDFNAHCQAGLACISDNGSKFGFAFTLDMCAGSHCKNKILDGDETAIDCGGSCSAPGFNCATYCANHYWPRFPVGTNSHCTLECPCPSGEGDCDSVAQCQAGLACPNNNGNKFGFPAQEFCVPPSCVNGVQDAGEVFPDCGASCSSPSFDCGDICTGYQTTYPNGHNSHCTTTCPCATGNGDCDSDAQCQAGLVCINNNGDKFGFPGQEFCAPATCRNGVLDGGETAVDCGGPCSSIDCNVYCASYQSTYPNGTNNHCTSTCPCASGEGDCDYSAQCQPGLVCGSNNSIKFGFVPGTDHCVPPNCVNGVLDIGETAIDCGGQCGDCGQFDGLGDLAGGAFASYAQAVSSDGAVVVGRATSADGSEAFRWTLSGGMQGLSDLGGGAFNSAAYAVSSNGVVVVGEAAIASGDIAFRWTASGGMVSLGDLAGGLTRSEAYGISSNGLVIVGPGSSAAGAEAFLYSGGTMTGLGDLAGGIFASQAWAVNGEGTVIVGRSESVNGYEAFRWTSGGGMEALGDLAGGSYQSHATAVSASGSIIAGYSTSGSGVQAFRWTASAGMVGLGYPAGMTSSYVYGISSNGSRIVGTATDGGTNVGFLWTSAGGMQNLQTIIESQGGSIAGWTILGATGISGDGKVIVGYAENPLGDTEAFRAVIP